MDGLEHFFTAAFCIEAYIRIKGHGWPWIFEFYNFIDLMLIFVTGVLVMWIFLLFGVESGFIRNLQVLRLLRMVKLVRAAKSIPAMNLVWRMIRSLIASGRILF